MARIALRLTFIAMLALMFAATASACEICRTSGGGDDVSQSIWVECGSPDTYGWGYTECEVKEFFRSAMCVAHGDLCYYVEVRGDGAIYK